MEREKIRRVVAVRFADDTLLFPESTEELKVLVKQLEDMEEAYGLVMNQKNTNVYEEK